VLLGAERGKFPEKDFPRNVATFINSTITALRSGDGQSLAAYSHILAYQIEDQVNHAGLHQPFYPQYVAPLVAQVAAQIRQTEQSALKGAEMNSTPLLVNFSFDFELILKQAIAGATMTDDAYAQAYARLKQMLLAVAATPDIDLIDVQWLAGSLSAGSPEKFAPLLGSLTADLSGKHFIFTTGFSTAFRSGEDQKSFFALTSVNLADYRAGAGMDSPFLGVMFREALKGNEQNLAPPKPQTPTEMASWNWQAKANQMIDTWSTKNPSPDMIWWLRKVEGNLGLFTLQPDGSGNPSIAAGPAQETLQQFATAVSESSTAGASVTPSAVAPVDPVAVPAQPDTAPATGIPPASDPSISGAPPSNPSFKNLAKEKAQQGMATLMDRVIERLGNKLGGAGGVSPSGASGPGVDSSGVGPPPSTPPSISVASGDVVITPAAPHAGESVGFSISLRNPGSPDATGLVVALVDEMGSLLGVETQLTDVVVAAGATQIVALNWIAGEPRTYQPSLTVLDSTLTTQLASLALPPLVVSAAPGRAGGAISTSAAIRAGAISPAVASSIMLPIGLPHVRSISLGAGPEGITAGAPSPITVALSNPYGRPLSNVTATLLVDGRPVASKLLGTLLPKQDRSVLFPAVVFARTGAQQVRVQLESRGTRTLTGYVARQVMIGPTAGPIASIPNPRPVTPPPAATAQPPGARPTVRPLLPSLIGGTTGKTVSGPAPSEPSGSARTTKPPPAPGIKPGAIVSPVGPLPTSVTPVKNPSPSSGGRDKEIQATSPAARVAPRAGKPDLTIEWITYPTELPAGGVLVVKVKVKNIGTAKASGTASAGAAGYMIDIMLSRDTKVPDVPATYSASFAEDALLGGGRISGTRDINPGESQEYGARVAIPRDAPKPKIIICARVDSGNKITELNERNNVACWATSVR
jgi:CARDB